MDTNVLQSILLELRDLKAHQASLEDKLESLVLGQPQSPQVQPSPAGSLSYALSTSPPPASLPPSIASVPIPGAASPSNGTSRPITPRQSIDQTGAETKERFRSWASKNATSPAPANAKPKEHNPYAGRIVLTSYPGQMGVNPMPLSWGHPDPQMRGVVLASRHPDSIKYRNAIGTYNGSYATYKALATAIGQLNHLHRPNFLNTEPAFEIPFQPSWADPKKLVAMDPFGHIAPSVFKKQYDEGVDVRPTIAITKAHLKVLEIDEAVRFGRIPIDGKIVLASTSDSVANKLATATAGGASQDLGVEVNVSKAAVEPVWYLPGVAERFGISEGLLRRALFEDSGGSYPELITRPDLKVFLPPIGGLTVYIFGPPEYLSDPSKELTVRVHDECNGSDVFGSDICTCRPYLLYGIEEAIRGAQSGGVGLVVYFRKEGRALGEVTKYLVYNARKRSDDKASMYFQRTEDIAGVKDMRFQALMPDVLHWLGVKKIDHMISMSDMKHDAIVNSGIPIGERHEIPEHLIPPDSRVEIDAKIAAGYWSGTKNVTLDDLQYTQGRKWDEAPVKEAAALWEDVNH